MGHESQDGKGSKRYGGAVLGLIVGCLVVGFYVLKLSKAEFHDTSKISLLVTVLAFVGIGTLFGDKFMEKSLEWLSWF